MIIWRQYEEIFNEQCRMVNEKRNHLTLENLYMNIT